MNFQDIFIIIVLYKTRLEDSITIQSLNESLDESITLMVFDNSPEKQYLDNNFFYKGFNVNYYHNGANPGLSHAYNLALDEAIRIKKDWLLLLDQDTTVTKEYIDEIKNLDLNLISDTVVSVIPRVVSFKNEEMIAPTRMLPGGACRPLLMASGVVATSISGINSGTLLRVSFINSINGFSSKYTLDMLDHWYFREINKENKEIYLLQNSIKQDLSVFGNFEENISLTRYKQLLNAESVFISEDGFISFFVFKIRLLFRFIKQINYKNKGYYKLTLKELFKTKYLDNNNLNKC